MFFRALGSLWCCAAVGQRRTAVQFALVLSKKETAEEAEEAKKKREKEEEKTKANAKKEAKKESHIQV